MNNIFFYTVVICFFTIIMNLDFNTEEYQNKNEKKYNIIGIKQDSLQLTNNDTTFWFKVTESVINKKHVNDSITIVYFVK